jgi:hypothetical protein
MSLVLRIAIGWSVAIVLTIALWNLGFVLAARRQRALEAKAAGAAGDRTAETAPATRRTPTARMTGERRAVTPRAGTGNGRRARAG